MAASRMSEAEKRELLEAVLPKLRVVKGPDWRGEHVCWCPFHPDGEGKPPHNPNLYVSVRGFICHACKKQGGLRELAEELGVDVPSGSSQFEATFDYRDENMELLYQVCRFPGKQFRQRQPGHDDGWRWNLEGVRRVLYRLPELHLAPGKRVYVTEGEKDCDELIRRGLLAVTNSGGAGKWRDEYSESLAGRDVVILPDNDEPGIAHAAEVAESLLGVARSVKILPLPELPEKGDVSDWLAGGHTVQELEELADEEEEQDEAPLSRVPRLAGQAVRPSAGDRSTGSKLPVAHGKSKRRREKHPQPCALFDGLVDVVQVDESPAFLVMDDGPPRIASSATVRGKLVVPPDVEQMPWLLPGGGEVLGHYYGDDDGKLFADLVAHHRAASKLPDEAMYGLLALWDMHTYLLDKCQFSPYICLHGVPERGKTRTGHALAYVAHRGMCAGSLRESYIFRMAEECRCTLFFDARDVWRKAVQERSEDLLLQRFQRGGYVTRVEHPERGPLRHSRHYEVFGATVIGTNVAPAEELESRMLMITMPEAEKDFAATVTRESALPLKERLVAFRARHIADDLPDAVRPARGRLGDLLWPLAKIRQLVAPEFEGEFARLAQTFQRERQIIKGQSLEAMVLVALLALEKEVSNGVVPLKRVRSLVNSDKPQRERMTPQALGSILRALALSTRRRRGGSVLAYDARYIKLLASRHGVEALELEPTQAEP